MVTEIIFMLDLINALFDMKKKYTRLENIKVFFYNFKRTIWFNAYFWTTIFYVMMLYQLYQVIGETKWEQHVAIYGTLGNAIGIWSSLFIIGLTVFIFIKLFEENKTITEIKKKYGDDKPCN